MNASTKLNTSSTWVERLGLVETSVRPDGSGLTVRVAETTPGQDLKNELEGYLGLADGLFFEGNTDKMILQASRNADAAPWTAGQRISTSNGQCTSGFNVLFGSIGYISTAHHCDPSADLAVYSGEGTQIAPGGSSVSAIASIDSQMIDPTASPATGPYIYVGAWNSSTKFVVNSWAANNVGDLVCLSGATSGSRCGTIIDDAVQSPFGLPGNFYIKARSNSGWLSAGGDSGGAWYTGYGSGSQARGIHLGGATFVPCGDVAPDVSNPECTEYSYYIPISVVLNTWGAKLEVG